MLTDKREMRRTRQAAVRIQHLQSQLAAKSAALGSAQTVANRATQQTRVHAEELTRLAAQNQQLRDDLDLARVSATTSNTLANIAQRERNTVRGLTCAALTAVTPTAWRSCGECLFCLRRELEAARQQLAEYAAHFAGTNQPVVAESAARRLTLKGGAG